jgi:hypothetical protein
MIHNWIRITLYGSLVLLLVACSQGGASTLPVETQPQPAATLSMDDTQMTQPSPSANIESQVEKAKEDLAQRLSIAISEINLLEARQVTWPDGSLGCPQPGMVYTQVPVEGLLIRLGVGKAMYFYHSGRSGDPFLCESTSQIFRESTPKTDEFVPPPDSEID